ncbi:MAG: preprotein translocase subunit YajC [Acidimicrobiia bacterium]
MDQLVFLLLVFGLMWFVLIRPQQQRVRRQQELVRSLEVGDEVVTAGGVFGRIVGVDDEVLRIEVAPGVELRFLRLAVTSRAGEAGGPPPAGQGTDDPGTAEPLDGGSR